MTNKGAGVTAALEQAAAAAAYRDLNKKETLRLCLLAEEMLGMLREITGETEAGFWLESQNKRFSLHLTAHPVITAAMRTELLSVSTSGKNDAAVGFMGKLRDIMERAFDATEVKDPSAYYLQGLLLSSSMEGLDPMTYSAGATMVTWSMEKYKRTILEEKENNAEAMQEWDELEKSIVANLADEVRISLRGRDVELTVYKDFG